MSVWDRFESIVNAEDVIEAKAKFEPIETGTYQMTVESIEASESKSGLPMLKGKFRTEENRVVFYNQMLQNLNYPNMTAVNIGEAVTFIDGLTKEEIPFTSLTDLETRINNIAIGEVHTISVSYGVKDIEHKFAKLKVMADEEIPF